MDKNSILLGILFLGGGFVLMLYNAAQQSEARERALEEQMREQEKTLDERVPDSAPPTRDPEIVPEVDAPQAVREQLPDPGTPAEKPEEILVVLENDTLAVTLSSYGGAVKRIELKNYSAENPHEVASPKPVVLNRVSDSPALALNRSTGRQLAPLVRFYEVTRQEGGRVTFRGSLSNGLVVERTYELKENGGKKGPDPYLIEHHTVLRNPSASVVNLEQIFLNIGTAAPTEADHMGFNLNASYYENGDYDNIPARKFSGGGFFGGEPKERIEKRGLLQWGAVKNQFFATILTPETPADAIVARGIRFPPDPATGKVPVGVTAALEFSLPSLQPGGSHQLSGQFYTGPKNLDRLSGLGGNQDEVMQLGWFLGLFLGFISFIAKSLLTLMNGIHGLLGNWGIAIILTTFLIRLALWPLTAKAARASKRMQKLQQPLQEIREKYQDNPQKLNQEMMKLWKKHKINPLSGCWPVLIQLPIFISFFNLLRNSSDLRFAEFLWITDLSMPDQSIPLPGDSTIPFLGAAINILPFVWLVSMYFQMKMMPTPSADNAQMKIIRFMPFIFFPVTYYFSSGLVLYWTTTNVFSIFQQWTTNRRRDDEDEAIEEEIAEMEEKKSKSRKSPSGPLIKKKKKKKQTRQ